MRYTLFIAIVLITFTSCKKDYVCSCAITNTLAMTPFPATTYTSTDIRKANKTTAQKACTEYETALDGNNGEYNTVECILK